jgi:hypothetical protein
VLGTAQLGEEHHPALKHDAFGNGAIFSGGRGEEEEGALGSLRGESSRPEPASWAGGSDGQPLKAHKGEGVRELIEERGCELVFLPPYSPDFNPIEQAFSKVKGMLRGA